MMLGMVASSLADLARRNSADPTPENRDALEQFGRALFLLGGAALLVRVFDETIDRFGWDACVGVATAWSGIPGWDCA